MLARALSATPWGIEARPVQVEVDVQTGLPVMQIVGLPDAAVRESRERVRSALRNCGFDLPPRAVTINLAPADLRKEGNHLDLAIALALLAAHGALPPEALAGSLLCGELGLDGAIRPVRGGLAIADLGRRLDCRELLLPAANAGEAAATGALAVHGLRSVNEAVEHLLGIARIPETPSAGCWELDALGIEGAGATATDFAEIRGQEAAKRALEVAAAGGHNLLLIGPPGAGKTMMARALPSILPPLTLAEAVAVTKIHSLVAERPPAGLLRRRPFRAPHPGVSAAGMVGGGPIPRPGEVSLAHGGVLFLDELGEFHRDALEALRQPLEEGQVTVVRARAWLQFPARFTLLAAMNPCPCGHLGDQRRACRCPLPAIERYRARVSGPLLDRIDLHVEVPAIRLQELKERPAQASADLAARVLAARERQRRRFPADHPSPVNASLTATAIYRECPVTPAGQTLLDAAFERLGLSARALHRVLKVARTIADLADSERIEPAHLAEAIQYRSLDRRMAKL
ncbi:MAG: YifB family Mg chelatase-like AAA ATPase [Thermoanaerobaculia bacterium]